MKDYYKTLGLEKNATKDDIKKAFRKLAHEFHPDKNRGNIEAEKKFKEASEAYSVLSDDEKRKQYNMFGSAGADGFNAGENYHGGFGQGFNGFQGFNTGNGQGFHFDFSNFGGGQGVEFDLGDIFSDFFGQGRAKRPKKGNNITIDINISFKESVFGVEKDISIGGKENLAIKIPPGIEDGQGLRISGRGERGEGGRGDLIVRVWVAPHPHFRKEGYNLITELPVKLTLALTGGTIDFETIDGKIELKIPQGATHNEILRIKRKGVMTEDGRRGDLLIVTKVEMPRKLSREAQKLIEELKKEGI